MRQITLSREQAQKVGENLRKYAEYKDYQSDEFLFEMFVINYKETMHPICTDFIEIQPIANHLKIEGEE